MKQATNADDALLPGSKLLSSAAKLTAAARGAGLRRWSKADKLALDSVLEYVRRSYKTPGAVFPRLVPSGMGTPQIVCGNHHVATFSSYEVASSAETIARQAAETVGLPV